MFDPGMKVASGGERVGIGFLVDRDRLEAIVAGAAEPEERGAARAALDPVGPRDRLAALCTGNASRQIAGVESSHYASPFGRRCGVSLLAIFLNGTGLLSK